METNPGFTHLAMKDHWDGEDVYDWGYPLPNATKRLDQSEALPGEDNRKSESS